MIASSLSMAPGTAAQVLRRPSVVGWPYSKADSALSRLRITVVARDSFVTGGSDGIVLIQLPPAGTPVRPGDVDTLVIARVTSPRLMNVPNVVGDSYRVAVAKLRRARFSPQGPTLSPTDSARATISLQSPEAPGPAIPGSPVRLTVVLQAPVRVPQLVGRDTNSAVGLLRREMLSVGDLRFEFNDRYGAGLVFHQDPEARALAQRGDQVSLWVSRGRHRDTTLVMVPSVIGLTPDSAATVLSAVRLAVDHVDTVESPRGDGRVAHQQPHGGDTAHVGDRVRLTVWTGVRLVSVPSLAGLTMATAGDTLRAVGLALGGIQIVHRPSEPDSVVVGQSEPPGARLAPGTPVGIDLNLHRTPERVLVPGVIGLPHHEAVRVVITDRLSIGRVTFGGSGTAGVVLDQAPTAGDSVEAGAAVDLTVAGSAPPPETRRTVPSLIDSMLARAVAILGDSGFSNLAVDSLPPAPREAPAWVVTAQAPGAGERVLPSTMVQLTVVPAPAIPQLVELREEDAAHESADAGFRMVVGERSIGLRLAGTRVAFQSPAAFTAGRPGQDILVRVRDPIPLLLSIPAAVGALALLTGWLVRRPPLRQPSGPDLSSPAPDFAMSVETGNAEVTVGHEGDLSSVEVSIRTRVERGPAEVAMAANELL